MRLLAKRYRQAMTKLTTFILFLIFSLTSFGQKKTKVTHMTVVDFLSIDHADMHKYTVPIEDSTIGTIRRQLDSNQIKKFVDEWNKANYKGPCKFKPLYRIDLYFKDGTKRTFQINGTVKETRDYCYEFSDKKYFKDLWKNTK